MTHKNKDPRPLSPHLGIYAWNISSLTSIMHRATGVLLYFSIIAVSWYVVLYTYQANPNGEVVERCHCPVDDLLLYGLYIAVIGIIFSLYYHFCNGIRHLFWDIGKGFKLETAQTNGYLVIILAVLLTIVTIGAAAYFKFM